MTVSSGGDGGDGTTAGGGGTGGSGAASTGSTTSSTTTSTSSTTSTTTTSSTTSTTTTTTTSGGFCGDGVCAGSESCQTCPNDCDCCGNGVCDANECAFCPQDCGNSCCGNGVCDFLEDCASCVVDCGPGCCPNPNPGNANGPSIYLFTNYDGGAVNVDVSANVPNIVLGFVSYEAMTVTITGAFAGNVTAVHYAGYNDVPGSTVTGVPANLVSITQLPPVTLMDPSGNPSIVCNYGGGCADQGGCNTAAQVKDYFVTKFAGKIASHTCQYEVYPSMLSTSVIAACN